MAYQVRNIIVGAAALYLSTGDSTQASYTGAPALPAVVPAGTAITGTTPALTSDGSQAVALEGAATSATPAWRHAGYTTEGLELAYEPDYTDIEVDQLLDSAKIFKSGLRVSLNTTLVEASLENLLIAWGMSGAPLDDSDDALVDADDGTLAAGDEQVNIDSGALGDEPVERALAAVGPGPRTVDRRKRERVYVARRVISVEATTVALRRTEATTFPVSFRLLPDPAYQATKSQYGFIRDRVYTAAA